MGLFGFLKDPKQRAWEQSLKDREIMDRDKKLAEEKEKKRREKEAKEKEEKRIRLEPMKRQLIMFLQNHPDQRFDEYDLVKALGIKRVEVAEDLHWLLREAYHTYNQSEGRRSDLGDYNPILTNNDARYIMDGIELYEQDYYGPAVYSCRFTGYKYKMDRFI